MAPQPKRKHSQRRGRVRARVLKARLAQLVSCPSCKQPTPRHSVCPHCGFYKEKLVVIPKKKTEKKAENEDTK